MEILVQHVLYLVVVAEVDQGLPLPLDPEVLVVEVMVQKHPLLQEQGP